MEKIFIGLIAIYMAFKKYRIMKFGVYLRVWGESLIKIQYRNLLNNKYNNDESNN